MKAANDNFDRSPIRKWREWLKNNPDHPSAFHVSATLQKKEKQLSDVTRRRLKAVSEVKEPINSPNTDGNPKMAVLTELSKDTLQRYLGKAKRDRERRVEDSLYVSKVPGPRRSARSQMVAANWKKAQDRRSGIDMAKKRISEAKGGSLSYASDRNRQDDVRYDSKGMSRSYVTRGNHSVALHSVPGEEKHTLHVTAPDGSHPEGHKKEFPTKRAARVFAERKGYIQKYDRDNQKGVREEMALEDTLMEAIMGENPLQVQNVFGDLIQDKIRNEINTRKFEIAKAMWGGGEKTEGDEEEVEVVPDESEVEEDTFEISDEELDDLFNDEVVDDETIDDAEQVDDDLTDEELADLLADLDVGEDDELEEGNEGTMAMLRSAVAERRKRQLMGHLYKDPKIMKPIPVSGKPAAKWSTGKPWGEK